MSGQRWGLLLAALVGSILLSIWVPGGEQITIHDSAPTVPVSVPREPIDQLTQQQRVVNYLKQHQRLPDYYFTKRQLRAQGWNAQDGNLCQVLPGKAIGGDRFSNRERRLPASRGRIWYEADVNYQCGHRGAERLLYSNDGLIYLTRDHYKSFVRLE